MMKQLTFLIVSALIFTSKPEAQVKTSQPATFDIVVAFGSMCCGTASDTFLKEYYKKFLKTNKSVIPASLASGCGREGEFKVMFNMSKTNTVVRKKFIAGLKRILLKEEKKNRARDESSGTISIEYNVLKDDVAFCRGGISKW